MSEVKQVICIRKDLHVRRGKSEAQAAHASMKVLLDMMDFRYDFSGKVDDVSADRLNYTLTLSPDSPIFEWLEGTFTKVCLSVDSEGELENLYQQAKEANLPCSLIIDLGKTEFGGVPTKTCIAIGPWYSEEINKITGHLKLR